MAIVGRRPRIRAVAQATILSGIEVPGIHSGCSRTVVTRGAGAEYLIVINGYNRSPDIGVVTILTDVGGQRMQWTLASRI